MFSVKSDGKIDYRAIEIASLAVQAILYEAACHPSPGLVSKVSQGAHGDMDYYTFLDSAAALINPLVQCSQAGFSPRTPKEIFLQIRGIGQLGEKMMLQKTKGVNTHKGTLFLMGICCAAAGKAVSSGAGFSALPGIIRAMTEGLVAKELTGRVRELERLETLHPSLLSHGEKLFLSRRVTGIRGEAERGLPAVFNSSLPVYRESRDLSQNARLVQTLLTIMEFCEDTNILYRHSWETLKEVQARAGLVLALGGMRTAEGIKATAAMDEDFSRRGISPGGSADLLGVTVLADLLEDYLRG